MGAWSSLALSTTTLKGIAPVDLLDPDFEAHDTERTTAERVTQAKRYIQMRLMRDLSGFVERADGPAEFLDAVVTVDKSHLNDLLQMMLGYAFMFHYYEQEAIGSNTIYEDRGGMMRKYFEESLNAFVTYIRLDEDVLEQAESTTDDALSTDSAITWVG
jgi:hypothetical protein